MSMTIIKHVTGAALLCLSLAASAGDAPFAVPDADPWQRSELLGKLATVSQADPRRGKELHEGLMCASCHGPSGVSPSRNYPHLAGQRAEYTYKQLLDYRSGRRHEGTGQAQIMYKLTQLLDEQDMRDLAAYYASEPLPVAANEGGAHPPVPDIARRGDPGRLLTACASCHGLHGQGGLNETPALAGQEPAYFIRTMGAFRDAARRNDLYEGMAQFAQHLSDAEIEALADYYARVSPR